MAREISNWDDVIDSRDVIERLAELDDLADPDTDYELDDAEETERTALRALVDEGEGFEDWRHGATLIRDSYFEDYARELADDLGMTPNDVSWPLTCIDWEQATRELQMDYTSIDFDGTTYWTR
jgi:hypothetical protein